MKAVILGGGLGMRVSDGPHLKSEPMIEIGNSAQTFRVLLV